MNTITLISGVTGVLTVKTDANSACVDSSSIKWHNIVLAPKVKFYYVLYLDINGYSLHCMYMATVITHANTILAIELSDKLIVG